MLIVYADSGSTFLRNNLLRVLEVLGFNPPVQGQVIQKTVQMVITATLCNSQHLKSLSKGNNASAYVKGLRMTMLQIHLYKY